jgi:hypothetical protein
VQTVFPIYEPTDHLADADVVDVDVDVDVDENLENYSPQPSDQNMERSTDRTVVQTVSHDQSRNYKNTRKVSNEVSIVGIRASMFGNRNLSSSPIPVISFDDWGTQHPQCFSSPDAQRIKWSDDECDWIKKWKLQNPRGQLKNCYRFVVANNFSSKLIFHKNHVLNDKKFANGFKKVAGPITISSTS